MEGDKKSKIIRAMLRWRATRVVLFLLAAAGIVSMARVMDSTKAPEVSDDPMAKGLESLFDPTQYEKMAESAVMRTLMESAPEEENRVYDALANILGYTQPAEELTNDQNIEVAQLYAKAVEAVINRQGSQEASYDDASELADLIIAAANDIKTEK